MRTILLQPWGLLNFIAAIKLYNAGYTVGAVAMGLSVLYVMVWAIWMENSIFEWRKRYMDLLDEEFGFDSDIE